MAKKKFTIIILISLIIGGCIWLLSCSNDTTPTLNETYYSKSIQSIGEEHNMLFEYLINLDIINEAPEGYISNYCIDQIFTAVKVYATSRSWDQKETDKAISYFNNILEGEKLMINGELYVPANILEYSDEMFINSNLSDEEINIVKPVIDAWRNKKLPETIKNMVDNLNYDETMPDIETFVEVFNASYEMNHQDGDELTLYGLGTYLADGLGGLIGGGAGGPFGAIIVGGCASFDYDHFFPNSL